MFIVPLQKDAERFTCEGKLRVYRSRDEGKSWQPLTKGLPQKNAYEVILRDAVTSVGDNIFFGTKNGKLFGSMAHGHAAPAAVKNAVYDVVTATFNGEYADGAAAAAALAEAVAAAQ